MVVELTRCGFGLGQSWAPLKASAQHDKTPLIERYSWKTIARCIVEFEQMNGCNHVWRQGQLFKDSINFLSATGVDGCPNLGSIGRQGV